MPRNRASLEDEELKEMHIAWIHKWGAASVVETASNGQHPDTKLAGRRIDWWDGSAQRMIGGCVSIIWCLQEFQKVMKNKRWDGHNAQSVLHHAVRYVSFGDGGRSFRFIVYDDKSDLIQKQNNWTMPLKRPTIRQRCNNALIVMRCTIVPLPLELCASRN